MTALRFALGDYAHTAALKAAGALPNGVAVEYPRVSPIHRAFAPMAREGSFDLAEMAIVTALQAVAHGKPVLVLPATIAARAQHRCLIRLASRDDLSPEALRGRRIGVRAYTQTTGMWVRAILAESHGVSAQDVTWVTQEGAHVAEYADPPQVQRAPEGASLVGLLDEGAVDAAILGNDLPDDPRFVPVIAQPQEAARAWTERHGIPQVNHLLVARADLAEARPDALRAAYVALRDAAGARATATGADALPFGVAALTPVLDYVLQACLDQGLLPRRLTAGEVLAPAARILGEEA